MCMFALVVIGGNSGNNKHKLKSTKLFVFQYFSRVGEFLQSDNLKSDKLLVFTLRFYLEK